MGRDVLPGGEPRGLSEGDLHDPTQRAESCKATQRLFPQVPTYGIFQRNGRPMTLWRFTLIIEGGDVLEGETVDLLFEAGCDDATFGWSCGVQEAGFDREADSLEEAVCSAVSAVESVEGFEIVRLVDDSTVTVKEIAEVSGRSIADVQALIGGHVGPGGFPETYSFPDEPESKWVWRDVARWFVESFGETIDRSNVQPYAPIAKLIEARHHYRKRDPATRREIAALLSD